MTLFDEVQQLSSESHGKWFERYFKKYNLEKVIKESAKQGYTGHLMSVLKVKDEYTRRRLDDEKDAGKNQGIARRWFQGRVLFDLW